MLGLAADPIMTEFGLSPSAYGLLSSSFFFLFSLSALVMGFVSNRVRVKWILFTIALIWALTQLPVLVADGLGALLVSRTVLGAAEGPAQRGAVMSLTVALVTLAGLIAPYVTGRPPPRPRSWKGSDDGPRPRALAAV